MLDSACPKRALATIIKRPPARGDKRQSTSGAKQIKVKGSPAGMSLRLAATTSTSSSFVSSSTPTATPVTPHADASSSFHVFRATESPPPSLSNGTYGISSRDSVPPPTPVFTEVDIANGEKIAAISSANGLVEVAKGKGKEKEKEKEKPCVTVDIDAAAEDARQRGRQKGRRDEEVEAMAQTAARCACRHILSR